MIVYSVDIISHKSYNVSLSANLEIFIIKIVSISFKFY